MPIFRRRASAQRRQRNLWLAAGAPMLGLFGTGFLLRIAFGSGPTPATLVWFGYGGPGLIGLVLTIVGVAKARRARTSVASE